MEYSVRDAAGVEIAQTAELYDAVMLAEAQAVYRGLEHVVSRISTGEHCVTVTKNDGRVNRIGWNGKPFPTALFRFS